MYSKLPTCSFLYVSKITFCLLKKGSLSPSLPRHKVPKVVVMAKIAERFMRAATVIVMIAKKYLNIDPSMMPCSTPKRALQPHNQSPKSPGSVTRAAVSDSCFRGFRASGLWWLWEEGGGGVVLVFP